MTTDPTIIQAAERVFRGPSAYRAIRRDEALAVHPDLIQDFEEIARHVLAEHPADDGEAITPEWLLSVGFTLDHEMEPPRDPVYCIRSLLWRPHYFGVNQGTWQFGPVTIDQNPKTRGDVRRLCAALGIPLPDQPKGGA
jgi:hypothetical protein